MSRYLAKLLSLMLLCLILGGRAEAVATSSSEALIKSLQLKIEEELSDGLLLRQDMAAIVLAGVRTDEADGELSRTRLVSMLRGPIRSAVYLCDICDAQVIQRGSSTEFRAAMDDMQTVKTYVQGLGGPRLPGAAMWVEISNKRLHYRIVAIDSGRVLSASMVSLDADYAASSLSGFSRSRNLEIKARGDAIMHSHIDLGLYPVPHVGLNFLQQWGSANHLLTGLALNFADPTGGLGVAHYFVLRDFRNSLLGIKAVADIPQVVGSAMSNSSQESKAEMFSMAVLAKVPLVSSNGSLLGLIYASTGGAYGIGISW